MLFGDAFALYLWSSVLESSLYQRITNEIFIRTFAEKHIQHQHEPTKLNTR